MSREFKTVPVVPFDPAWIDKETGLPLGIKDFAAVMENGESFYGVYLDGDDRVRTYYVERTNRTIHEDDPRYKKMLYPVEFNARFMLGDSMRIAISHRSVVEFGPGGTINREYLYLQDAEGNRVLRLIAQASPKSNYVPVSDAYCISCYDLPRFIGGQWEARGYNKTFIEQWSSRAGFLVRSAGVGSKLQVSGVAEVCKKMLSADIPERLLHQVLPMSELDVYLKMFNQLFQESCSSSITNQEA